MLNTFMNRLHLPRREAPEQADHGVSSTRSHLQNIASVAPHQSYRQKLQSFVKTLNCLRSPSEYEEALYQPQLEQPYKKLAKTIGDRPARLWQHRIEGFTHFTSDDCNQLIDATSLEYTCRLFKKTLDLDFKDWCQFKKKLDATQTNTSQQNNTNTANTANTGHDQSQHQWAVDTIIATMLETPCNPKKLNILLGMFQHILGAPASACEQAIGTKALQAQGQGTSSATNRAQGLRRLQSSIERIFQDPENKARLQHSIEIRLEKLKPEVSLEQRMGVEEAQAFIAQNPHQTAAALQFLQTPYRDFQASFDQALNDFSLTQVIYLTQFKTTSREIKSAFEFVQCSNQPLAPQTINDLLDKLLDIAFSTHPKSKEAQALLQHLKSKITPIHPFAIRNAEISIIPKHLKKAAHHVQQTLQNQENLSECAFSLVHCLSHHQQIFDKNMNILKTLWLPDAGVDSPEAKRLHLQGQKLKTHVELSVLQDIFEHHALMMSKIPHSDPRSAFISQVLLTSAQFEKMNTLLSRKHPPLNEFITRWEDRTNTLIRLADATTHTEMKEKCLRLYEWVSHFHQLLEKHQHHKTTRCSQGQNKQDHQQLTVGSLKDALLLKVLTQLEHYWQDVETLPGQNRVKTETIQAKLQDIAENPELDDFLERFQTRQGAPVDTLRSIFEKAHHEHHQLGQRLGKLLACLYDFNQDQTHEANIWLANYDKILELTSQLKGPLHDPEQEFQQHIVPLREMLANIVPKPSTHIGKAIRHEMIAHLNDLSQRLPAETLSIVEAFMNAQNPTDADYAILNAYQNLSENTPGQGLHKQPLVIDFYALNLQKNRLGINPHVSALLEKRAFRMAISHGLENPQRLAEAQIPLLAGFHHLESQLLTLKTTDAKEQMLEWLKHYQASANNLANGEHPQWVKDNAYDHLNGIQKNLLMKPDQLTTEAWRQQLMNISSLAKTIDLSPLELASQEIRNNKGVNLNYLYTDADITALLNRQLEHFRDQSPKANHIQITPAASDEATLRHLVKHWLSEDETDQSRLLVLPYSPTNQSGQASQHWTGLILSKAANGVLQVAYNDPLQKLSDTPFDLQNQLTEIVNDINKQEGSNFQLKPQNFLGLIHPQQSDLTSCGPFVVANLSEMMQSWAEKDGALPIRIITQKDAVELRQQHLETLGGIEGSFGQRQFWNIETVGGIELEDLRHQEDMFNRLVKALDRIPADLFVSILETGSFTAIKPYLNYSLKTALLQKTNGLGLDQMVQKACQQVLSTDRLHNGLITLKSLPKTLSEPLFTALEQMLDKDFEPGPMIQAIKAALEIIGASEEIPEADKLEIMGGFFKNTIETPSQNLQDLDFINLETLSMAFKAS